MKVSELLTRLSYGELSGLSWSGEGNGIIDPTRIPQLLSLINEGLLRLYARFVLRESELVLEEQSYLTHYILDFAHAHSNTARPPLVPGYIVDTLHKPFQDDVIRIFEVYDVNRSKYPLNDSDRPDSMYTPTPSTLQVIRPMQNRLLSIMYQAKPVPLTAVTDDVILPAVLEGALQAFVGHKVFHHMNGQENAAKSVEHHSVYEDVCAQVTAMDLVNGSQSATNRKFSRGGWR